MKELRLLKTIFCVLTVLTLILILLGSYVRATGAGLACPDWPLCYGRLVPDFSPLGVAQEWAHRALAGLVAILTVCAVLVGARVRKSFPGPFMLGVLLLILVVVQAIFGGLTVLMRLEPWVVATHLGLGTLFLQLTYYSKLKTTWVISQPNSIGRIRLIVALFGLIVFSQVVLGGYVAASGASLGCPKFPWCPELMGPEGFSTPALLLFSHGAWGTVVLLCAAILALVAHFQRLVDTRFYRVSLIVLAICFLQLLLGIGNVHMRIPVFGVLAHAFLAQAILMHLVLVCLYRTSRDDA